MISWPSDEQNSIYIEYLDFIITKPWRSNLIIIKDSRDYTTLHLLPSKHIHILWLNEVPHIVTGREIVKYNGRGTFESINIDGHYTSHDAESIKFVSGNLILKYREGRIETTYCKIPRFFPHCHLQSGQESTTYHIGNFKIIKILTKTYFGFNLDYWTSFPANFKTYVSLILLCCHKCGYANDIAKNIILW